MISIKDISQRRKIVVVVAVLLLLIISWSGFVDALSKEYVNSSTVQALAAYGFARLINAAVSLASSITITASFGLGFDIQPFQTLDPINDLVEQYSSAMKFSVSSLVVQKILVEAVSTLIFKVALTVLSILFIASIYFKNGIYSFFFLRLLLFFGMIRFLIVFVILMNGIVDQAFVDKNISPRMQEVSDVANNISSQTSASENKLSKDEKEGLRLMAIDLNSKREQLVDSLSIAHEEASRSAEEINSLKSKIEETESEMSTIERMNIFSQEESYRNLLKDLKTLEKNHSEKINIKNDLTERIDEIDVDIENTVDLLEGRVVEDNWLASASKKISNFRDMAKWERITETVESIVPSMLNLMAAFILKTLIMPLIFLLLSLKGFKYVWGVDPRRWIKEEYQKIKNTD